MVRRGLVAVALAVSVAAVAVAVGELSGKGTTRPPASRADVYTQLVQQLTGHLQSLVPAKATTKHAPSIQVPTQQGYTCEVASSNGCSLHPCVKYATAQVPVPVGPGVPGISSASSGRCVSPAKSTPHTIPIAAP